MPCHEVLRLTHIIAVVDSDVDAVVLHQAKSFIRLLFRMLASTGNHPNSLEWLGWTVARLVE